MSIGSQQTQQKFPFAYDEVFDALVDALKRSSFSLKSQDKMIGRINASASMSMFSWGENIVILVEKVDEQSTLVSLEGSLKFGANIAGAHRHHKNFENIISILSRELKFRTTSEYEELTAPKAKPAKVECPKCGGENDIDAGKCWRCKTPVIA
jgi:hypothetical protein